MGLKISYHQNKMTSNHVDEINLLYQEAKVILTFLDVLSSSSDVGQLQDSFQLAF